MVVGCRDVAFYLNFFFTNSCVTGGNDLQLQEIDLNMSYGNTVEETAQRGVELSRD